MAALPVHRGYPVPWFVGWMDDDGETELKRGEGTPDFRVVASGAVSQAYTRSLCWLCGQPRGRYAAFVIGPMCAVNRTSSEPPSHPECAGWSACACPFLARPHARRREAGIPEVAENRSGHISRNPGVALVWSSENWHRFAVPREFGGGHLFKIGDPEEIAWFAEGRFATRAEIEASIESGLPILHEAAEKDGPAALEELAVAVATVDGYLPES